MANKHQVLALLEKGLSPQEIAKKLKCSDAYVRATRQRATPEGRVKTNAYGREHGARYREENREKYNAYMREYMREYRK